MHRFLLTQLAQTRIRQQHPKVAIDDPVLRAKLIYDVAEAFPDAKPGYRDGVFRVPISLLDAVRMGFQCPITRLAPGQQLIARFEVRQPGEEPRLSTGVRRSEATPLPLHSVEAVVYSRAVLAEKNENENAEYEYEIITFLGNAIENEPIHPTTLCYNHFHDFPGSGGTNTGMNAQRFEAELRASFLYWRDKAFIIDDLP